MDAKTKVMTITPQIAREWLKENDINRNVNKNRVIMYSEDMKSGNWALNGESIKFNRTGKLIDGQHRLMAIIRSGVPIATYVIFDIPNDISIMDRGKNRSTTDSLIISGLNKKLANSHAVSIAKLHFSIKYNKTTVSDFQIRNFIIKHSECIEKVLSLCASSGGRKTVTINIRNATFMLAMLYGLEAGVNYEIVTKFVEIVKNGFYKNDEDSAAIVCRNDMLSKAIITSGHTCEKKQGVYKIEKALNDFANSIPRKKSYNSWKEPIYSEMMED